MRDRAVILVVDDSNSIRYRMNEILTNNGYEVILRENGEAGVLAALEFSPDLIIMDINMPKMNGYQACRMLKSYPQTKIIPVAVFTTENETSEKVKLFDIGVEDFIIKDADEEEVIARVSGLLRWKNNRDKIIRDKNKLGSLLDSLSDSVIIADNSGRLVYFNRSAAQRFGLIPELIKDKLVRELLPANDRVVEMFSRIENRHELDDYELTIEIDGEEKIFNAGTSRVFVDTSEDVGSAVILKDITAERVAEKLKSEFYSMIAHELRTPISVVLGYSRLILEGKAGEVTELQRDFLKAVEERGKILMKLVNDFLEVSRLENNFVNLKIDEFDISELVVSVVDGLKLLADNKNIKLTFDGGGKPLSIDGDRDKMEHVLVNLIENGIKYTEEGGRVAVSCMHDDDGIRVEVSDTGIGMDEDEQKFIFDRFKRLSKAEKKKIKGTGLGLAIVKDIVDAHGGRIHVESKEGEGSTFRVWLPGRLESPEDQAIGTGKEKTLV